MMPPSRAAIVSRPSRESRTVLAQILPSPYKRLNRGTCGTTAWSGGRPSSAVTAVHLHGLAAVLGQEGVFEARLSTGEIDEVVAGGRLDHGRHRPGHPHMQDAIVGDHIADARQAEEVRHRD